MRDLRKRMETLESAAPADVNEHWLFKEGNWDEDVVLDHYGRDRIGPGDKVTWIVWGRGTDGLPVYPAGHFDLDGRWARACAAHGAFHRDHAK